MKMIRLIVSLGIVFSFFLLPSCSNDNDTDQGALDQAAYDAADAIRGGQYYDKFWKVSTYSGPSDASVNQQDIEDFSNFYRCKQCHGWDQKARFGWYIDRNSNTSRPDVSAQALTGVKTDAIRTLFDEVAHTTGAEVDPLRTADGTNPALGGNDMPNFSKILTDAQIWDIVKFLREGAQDTEQLYDLATSGTYPTGLKTMTNLGKDGDAAVGDTFFDNTCAQCHGPDGKTILLEGKTLGEFARSGPHETQHKIKNGHPGSIMPGLPNATLTDVKNLLKALSDDVKYPVL